MVSMIDDFRFPPEVKGEQSRDCNETHFVFHTLFDDALRHKLQSIDACAFAEETKIVYYLVPKISKPLGADVNYIHSVLFFKALNITCA